LNSPSGEFFQRTILAIHQKRKTTWNSR